MKLFFPDYVWCKVSDWDEEILQFCKIMLSIEEIFAKSKTIAPAEFRKGKKEIEKLRKLVFEKLTREISPQREITVKFWSGLKFQ